MVNILEVVRLGYDEPLISHVEMISINIHVIISGLLHAAEDVIVDQIIMLVLVL